MEVALDVFRFLRVSESLRHYKDNVVREFIEAAPVPGPVLCPAIPIFRIPGVVRGAPQRLVEFVGCWISKRTLNAQAMVLQP